MCFVKRKALLILLLTDLMYGKYMAVKLGSFRSFIKDCVFNEYKISHKLVSPHHIPDYSLHFFLRDNTGRDPVLVFTAGTKK